MDDEILSLNPATVCCGMARKRPTTPKAQKASTARRLPTASPGKTEKRTEKALESAEGALALRAQIARNVQWIIDKSAARGSIPRLADGAGIGVNTVRRLLEGKGTSVDTLFFIANSVGLAPHALFDPLTDKDMRIVQMIEDLKKDMADLRAKTEPHTIHR